MFSRAETAICTFIVVFPVNPLPQHIHVRTAISMRIKITRYPNNIGTVLGNVHKNNNDSCLGCTTQARKALSNTDRFLGKNRGHAFWAPATKN